MPTREDMRFGSVLLRRRWVTQKQLHDAVREVDSIQGKVAFTLSAGDSVAGTAWFEITAIPEPATLTLLALGCVVAARRRRRRRR